MDRYNTWKRSLSNLEQWSHCGNRMVHPAHAHTIALNEGPYDVFCIGTPDLGQEPTSRKDSEMERRHGTLSHDALENIAVWCGWCEAWLDIFDHNITLLELYTKLERHVTINHRGDH